jgi:RimJ/RimL family protein N-acetyltransferase
MTSPPVLTTDRLLLRGHAEADFDAVHALWSDPLVALHISGRPATRSESWARLLRYVGHWSVVGCGYWAVVDRGTGRFLGEVGLAEHRRDVEPSFEGTPEAGWVFAPHAQGRGIAREAVRAALGWADANLAAERTVCMIAPDHAASCRLARDVGFEEAGPGRYAGETVALFERVAVR